MCFCFQDNFAYKYKKILAAFNISCFLIATYLYFRHNKYCETNGKSKKKKKEADKGGT